MLDAVQSTPRFNQVLCASGHYSAFSVKSCLMLSNPPPLQSGVVRLAITATSLSSHAWWCPIRPRFNQVLCIWPLQCLLCQVMLDVVQSTPASIRSCASGHYSAFSVKSCLMLSNPPPFQSGLVRLAITVPSLSSHAWWCPIHPRFNQVLCVWPSWRLLCQALLDAVQSTPASIRYCASGHCSAFSVLSSHYWCCPIHPHFNQVLCVWPLQCLLCQVMLDAVQSTPTSIRSCASGHYSAFSVKSCLMMSNPPPLQSCLVRLAITVPSLSSHAWWCPIHPRFNQVLCIWPLQCLLCQIMLDDVQSTPTSIRSCASGHYSAFSVKSCLMLANPPPLQSGLVRLAITVPSLSSHAWCCPIHPHLNQILCIWPLQCILFKSCLILSNPPPHQSGLVRLAIAVMLSNPPPHQSGLVRLAITVSSLSKSCLMMSNLPPLQSGLVRLAITVPSLSSHAWCCPIHPHFNPVLCVWPLQCLLCQVMLDDVQSTPASIRSCASGHYSAFSVKSCLMMSNPPTLQSGLVRLAITVPSLSSHAWCWPIHPHFNQVLCVWPLQCLLCQVMLDAVQSTPTSIRYCASGHYSAFSVKSCLILSNPPPHQSGLVRLAIAVILSNPPPHQSGLVRLAITVSSLSKSCLMMSNLPPLQSGLVRLAITVPSLSSHAWCCPIHPHFNQVLCVWPL